MVTTSWISTMSRRCLWVLVAMVRYANHRESMILKILHTEQSSKLCQKKNTHKSYITYIIIPHQFGIRYDKLVVYLKISQNSPRLLDSFQIKILVIFSPSFAVTIWSLFAIIAAFLTWNLTQLEIIWCKWQLQR